MNSAPAILLTGASRGLGLATLEILLKAGASVVALSRTETPELTALASTYPGVLIISKGDTAKDEDNKAAVDVAVQAFGRLDALILNAGTLTPLGTVASLGAQLSVVENLFAVNFFSLISIVGHALPYLKVESNAGDDIKGRIIMVSSGAATGGTGGWGAYSASKAAMNSLARTLGNEEPSIVTVAVRPGVVATEMQADIRALGSDHMKPTEFKRFTDLHQNNALLPPSKPGSVLAGLALKASADLSGSFVSWDENKMEGYALGQPDAKSE